MRAVLIIPTREGMIADHTLACVRALKEKHAEAVTVIIQPSSALLDFWRSEALYRGFACEFHTVVQMDADISAEPAEIVRFIADLGAAAIPQVRASLFASRFAPHGPVGWNMHRLPIMKDVALERAIVCPPNVYPGTAVFGCNRTAYDSLCRHFPSRVLIGDHRAQLRVAPLFHSIIEGDRWWGEDYSFFKRVEQAEVPLVIDPIRLVHGFGSETHSLW